MAVVDDMAAAVCAIAAAARQRRQMRAAEEDLDPIVVDDGTLEIKVLLSEGEIRIAAQEAKVYRAEVSRYRVAG